VGAALAFETLLRKAVALSPVFAGRLRTGSILASAALPSSFTLSAGATFYSRRISSLLVFYVQVRVKDHRCGSRGEEASGRGAAPAIPANLLHFCPRFFFWYC